LNAEARKGNAEVRRGSNPSQQRSHQRPRNHSVNSKRPMLRKTSRSSALPRRSPQSRCF